MSRDPAHRRPLRWLELSADYRCNQRCTGCFSVQPAGPSMDAREIVAHLVAAHRRGARSLWLGGGEPTLRRDAFSVVRKARELGYAQVLLQTNGMLLAYPEVTRRFADAGVTEVSFAIKGATPESHDRLTGTPGAHALLVEAMAQVRGVGLRMSGDLLAYASNVGELPEMVRAYAELGLVHFNVWAFSARGAGAGDLDAHVPRLASVARAVIAAADENPAVSVTSLHTPPCLIPESHARCRFYAADLDLLVANPGGRAFRLEESPIEGGTYLARCGGCSARASCGGLRPDYLALHGDAEFVPVASTVRSRAPSSA